MPMSRHFVWIGWRFVKPSTAGEGAGYGHYGERVDGVEGDEPGLGVFAEDAATGPTKHRAPLACL